MDVKKLIELRKEAEKAVVEMPDGDLKIKAFEVILNHLISGEGRPKQTQAEPDIVPTKKRRVEDTSIAGRLFVLKAEGFFKNPKSLGEIRQELQTHGWHYPSAPIAERLIALVQRRDLRRNKVKEGNKNIWKYSNP